jgi:hypothetical protein
MQGFLRFFRSTSELKMGLCRRKWRRTDGKIIKSGTWWMSLMVNGRQRGDFGDGRQNLNGMRLPTYAGNPQDRLQLCTQRAS